MARELLQDRLLAILTDKPQTVREIAPQVDGDYWTIDNALRRLWQQGRADQVSFGVSRKRRVAYKRKAEVPA